MKQALGYTRLSKDEEGSISLDYQRAAIEQYCQAHDLTLVGVESDNGISGKSIAARPAVQRVLQAVDTNAVDCVVVFRSDRMSRDGMESLQIEKLFLQRGVDYLSTSEGNLTGGSVDDTFMSFIRAGLNQRERQLISLRVKQALQRKREKGERLGGGIRYGWKVTAKQMVPDADEHRAVALVKHLQSLGYSTRQIVQVLEQEGVRTRKGTCFHKTQIIRILKVA